MRTLVIAALFSLFLLLVCCKGKNAKKDVADTGLDDPEEQMQQTGYVYPGPYRRMVRQAALEHVTAANPGCTVRGASTLQYTPRLFVVAVDFSVGERRQITHLVARLFVGQGSKTYWRVEPFNRKVLELFFVPGAARHEVFSDESEDLIGKTLTEQ